MLTILFEFKALAPTRCHACGTTWKCGKIPVLVGYCDTRPAPVDTRAGIDAGIDTRTNTRTNGFCQSRYPHQYPHPTDTRAIPARISRGYQSTINQASVMNRIWKPFELYCHS